MHRLALKLALAVAGVLALLLAAAQAAFDLLPLQLAAAVVGLTGAATYAAAFMLLSRPVAAGRQVLRHIRKHEFEKLQALAPLQGDELAGFVEEIRQTGLAVSEEIQGLRKAESYRREYVGNVSHELKTPIFSIQGFAETLLEGALEDERFSRAFVEKILHNAGRLNHLVRDLSEISRIETGKLRMTVAPFDLPAVMQEVAEALELRAQDKQVALACELPQDLPRIMGDREHIRQVLINLADNAIKYNDAGGKVCIKAAHASMGKVRIAVIDDGIGIEDKDIPRLTERFYRVDKSRSRDEGGTGLGLAIVKHILAAHDSKLHIESTPGRGSTFAFVLPAQAHT